MTTQWMKTFVLMLGIGVGLLFPTGCDTDDNDYPSYNVEVPNGAHSEAGKLKITALSETERAELEKQGHRFVGTPIRMTLGDQEHVFLQELATVSFDIPSDIAPEEYDNLIGVVFHKGQPTYMALDPVQLQEGKAVFKTAHFSEAGLMLESDRDMLNILLPRIAAGGYQKSMRDADLRKTAKERIAADMDKYGLSDNYLLGRVLGKIIEDNEFTSEIVELINSKDPAAHVTERATDLAAEKALEKLFATYQKKYKQNSAEAEKSELAEMLREHLTVDNAKDWATNLGKGASPSDLALQYAEGFAKSALKEFSKEMFPIIKVMQAEAKAIEVLKDFWVDNITEESFQAYKKLSPDGNGRISDDDWNQLAGTYMAAVIRQYRIDGRMTEAQIREMFEQRIKDRNALATDESKLRKQFDIWEKNLLFHRGNTRFTYDMDLSVRISILHNLTERFRKEFVVNGKIPRTNGSTLGTEEILADMVYHYLNFFPDTRKFYDWARKQGFYGDRLQRDLAELNKEGAWFFVKVEINQPKNTGQNNDDFYWSTFEASEGHHIYKVGSKYTNSALPPIQSASFEATCTFPPKKILQKGQVVLLHSTIKTEDTSDYWWRTSANVNFNGTIWSTTENLKGGMLIGSHKGDVKSGVCDFKLVIPSGSKGKLGTINFDACGSRTSWVYEWRGFFE